MTTLPADPTLIQAVYELEAHERAIAEALPLAEDPAELYRELLEMDEAREVLEK